MKPYSLRLRAVPVQQPIGEFFAARISARDLVEISYSDVRRLAESQRDFERYLGIQRPVSRTRVKEIKKYIQGRDATFPTAVIVAIDPRCAEYDETKSELILRPFEPDSEGDEDPIPKHKIARVIDGQHRIAAFMNEDNNWEFEQLYNNDAFDLNLAVFVGADVSEQANIFATVNLAQTKVNRSLVYDLTELANTPSPHKTCHNVAVMLDREPKSPLYHRIKRLGTATPGRRNEPLTQAAFVESLVKFISVDPVDDRNRLLDGKRLRQPSPDELEKCPFRGLFIANRELDIAEILFNYFSAVRNKWPDSWDALGKASNLLPKANAFKALMKFLKDDVYLAACESRFGSIPTVRSFSRFFEPIKLSDVDFTTRNFAPGSGGQSTFLRMLRREISLKDMLDQ